MLQKDPGREAPDRNQLLRLIRASRAFDAATRRHWLAVVDRLLPSQQRRLYEILSAETDTALREQGQGT